ncbi:MAG TPA: alpha/beta hydrolase [Solirubrobacteraceae bacterium]|nr:alpha/beta hydrolase [Solirubrobacteraceae bacterium]
MPDEARALNIATPDGVLLSGEESGAGTPVVLLHGLTATRRYVVHGSRALERSGHRVIAYDARGHGRSTPAGGSGAYRYERLAGDLEAVLDATGVQRAVLAGVSMGAHTIVRFALEHPERVAALAIITPAYDPGMLRAHAALAGWDALARGLREGGVEGFIRAYDLAQLPDALRPTVETVLRQRMSAHEHPDAVADALEAVPRARPFGELEQLATIAVPSVVVGSRDRADPRHPLAVAERYARTIPGAQLLVEDEGPPARSPLAWQGGRISSVIAELAERAQLG